MDLFITRVENLLQRKQKEAGELVQARKNTRDSKAKKTADTEFKFEEEGDILPFGVNKVIQEIRAEGIRRASVLKKKPTVSITESIQRLTFD